MDAPPTCLSCDKASGIAAGPRFWGTSVAVRPATLSQRMRNCQALLPPMVDAIVPAAKAVYGKPGDFVDNAVRENARLGAQKISARSKLVEHLEHKGKVKVVYARYDLI
jgi:hypothetical protein